MRYEGADPGLAAPRRLRPELDGGVLTVWLARPEAGNRLDVAATLEMQALLQAVAFDDAVQVVLVRGEGADFCLGLDDADFDADFHDAPGHGARVLGEARAASIDGHARQLRALPQPVIALVHGRCHGGGVALIAACDIVFAADDAEFVLAAAESDDTAPVRTPPPATMQRRAAAFHALTGGPFDGREAERNGLVTRSFPADALPAETEALARELAAKDPLALRFTKETLAHVGAMSREAALAFTAAKFAELKALQASRPSTRAAAVESFLSGKSKPGLAR